MTWPSGSSRVHRAATQEPASGGAAPGGQGSALWRQQHGLPHAGGAEPGLGGDLERLVRVGVECRGHLREGALHVGVAEVHLIDDRQDGEVLLEGEPEVGHRLRLGEGEIDRVWRVGAIRPASRGVIAAAAVCACTPLVQSTSSSAPWQAAIERETSYEKSTWPGVSMRLSR